MQKNRKGRARAITLRNIPAATERRIVRKAEAEGISLNKAVIRLLGESPLPGKTTARQGPGNDLAKYAGNWSGDEADEFDRHLQQERRIEPMDWQ